MSNLQGSGNKSESDKWFYIRWGIIFALIFVSWAYSPLAMEFYLDRMGAGANETIEVKQAIKESSPQVVANVFDYMEADGKKADIYNSFSALNTLFAGLAFAGVLMSLSMQRKAGKKHELEVERQIRDQKKKNELQQQEHENSIEATNAEIKRQADASQKQSFEQNFFQMLKMSNSLRDSVAIHPRGGSKLEGLDAIKFIYEGCFLSGSMTGTFDPDTKESRTAMIDGAFKNYQKWHHDAAGQYIRSVYQVLKYIDLSGIENDRFYSSLFRAQLSYFELALLFFNCLSEIGREHFKPLAEQYSLFKHLTLDEAIRAENVYLYKISVYGDNKELKLTWTGQDDIKRAVSAISNNKECV